MKSDRLSLERLKSVLSYDKASGLFTWIVDSGRYGRIKAGTVAGSSGRHGGGYVEISLDGSLHKAHRLAWLYVTGEYPEHQIDHINQNRSDNRWANLRHATLQKNLQNKAKYRNNSSGVTGVTWHKRIGMWQARIGVFGKRKHLGYWKSQDAAVDAYNSAKQEHHKFT